MVSSPLSLLRQPTRHNPRSGFALLITVTLVAFLVLVLVALATITRVETQVASNSQQVNQARQNALMALNIAIGQLQKYAGPDQRVTTTADLVATTDKNGTASPAPLYATTTPRLNVQNGSRYWTGVWGNTESNNRYDLRPSQIPPTTGNRRGVTPTLLNWLVSGNESASFSLKGSRGGVTEGTGITFGPNATVNLSDLNNPTINGKPAILLVGPNGVGTGTTASRDYVAAPLVPITAPAGTVPGITTSATTGNYAWWVGDEGVKARVNLQNGYLQTGQNDDQINSFITAQRTGIEFMTGPTTGTLIGTDYDFTDPRIEQLVSNIQLPLTASSTAARDRLQSAIQTHFHNITPSSFGVLSDTYAGGLKKDLTADIADTSANSSYRPADSASIFTPISTAEAYLPTWGHLRTWARTHPDGTNEITPHPATDSDAGIGPVLQYFAIGYDIRVRPDSSVVLAIFPVLAIYNPYPVTISANRYDVGFRCSANTRMTIQTAPQPAAADIPANEDANNSPKLNFTYAGDIDWGEMVVRGTDELGTKSETLRFTVDAKAIPPGESHIYYLKNTDQNYAAGDILERAPAGSNANPLNYVYLPSTLTLDSSVNVDPSDPDSSYMRIVQTNSYVSTVPNGSSAWGSKPRAQVTIATEGGLDNPDSWYQSHDVLIGSTGSHPGGQIMVFNSSLIPKVSASATEQFTHFNSERLRISNTDGWAGLTQGGRAAFRFCPRPNSGGDYNAADRIGMPQITTAWLRHANLRAPYGQLSVSESSAPRTPNRMGDMLYGVVAANDSASTRKVTLFPKANQYALGMAGSPDASTPEARNATFFDILEDSTSLLSLGQLQHAPFSRYSFQTAYSFANSMADLRIPRTTHYRNSRVARPDSPGTTDPIYDLSWHLNRAMWDKYFLSTIPASYAQADINNNRPPPNARMTYFRSDGAAINIDSVRAAPGQSTAYDKAATNLLNAGAFNINSTSEQAWRAVLAGTSGLPSDSSYASSGDNVGQIIPFPRFSRSLERQNSSDNIYETVPNSMVLDTTSGNTFGSTYYQGNRGLYLNDRVASGTNDSPQKLINELARTMVEQIRIRGPFLSLSDFVNRSMSTSTHALGIKGAIQSAIDNMASSQANPYDQWVTANNHQLNATSYYQNDVSAYAYPEWDIEHYLGGTVDDMNNHPERSAFRLQYAFGPKYLTQADILSTIGPSLSARSDTFTIRTYGEKTNPITNEVESQAWCEAVVQRIPDFVNPTNAAETALSDSSLLPENQTFGRKFVVVSLRWLSPSDI